MKRTLSAFDLTALSIGTIVGAGIFSLVGTASAGETSSSKIKPPLMNFIVAGLTGLDVQPGRSSAGPALVISLMLAAVACTFAAFCYAELASMIPVSGSAYTYSYATLGEIFAWIIGRDLILEYAVGNMAVADSWSSYFIKLLALHRRAIAHCYSLAGGEMQCELNVTSQPTVTITIKKVKN